MKRLSFLLCLPLAMTLAAAEPISESSGADAAASKTDVVNDPQTEANIAKSAARLLENFGFSRLKFDDAISAKFLERYFEMLDGQHLHFLQSDVEEFSSYRTNLDDLTLHANDTSPAHKIFARLLERANQRVAYAHDLLKNEKFDFKSKDRFTVNRKDSPRPKDMEEAKLLWRQNLRFEYLQEKLSLRQKEEAKKDEKNKALKKSGEKEEKVLEEGKLEIKKSESTITGDKDDKSKITNGKTDPKADKKKISSELEQKFAALFKDLKLTPKEQEKLISLKAEHQMLPKGGDKEVAAAQEQLDVNTKAILGDKRFKQFRDLENHLSIVDTLTKRYNRLQKNLKELSPDEVLEIYLTSLARVYDPHTDYMGRSQLENFTISMKLSLFGIGAVLTTDDQGYCKIMELKDGPAKRSKQIKPGDRITAVAQADKEAVECVGMKLNRVVEMIRGAKGTEVRLTVWPVDATDPSTQKVVPLIRDEIKLADQEAKAKVMDLPVDDGKALRVGVIDLLSFYEDMEGRKADHKSTSADVARILKKLNEEKVNGIILDLRRNGGGALSEAVKLSGLFIKKGPIVQTKDLRGVIDTKSDTDPSVLFDGPMIVLTSRFSASASEILAGAMQDYQRALIVGDSSTFGKGTVQQLVGLENVLQDAKLDYAYNPGGLKFTIQKFYRAGGSSTQLKGVVPDLILPSVNNHAEIGERFDFDNALPEDDVSSAKFEKLNRVNPYLAELKKISDKRLQANKDFSYIQEDIEKYKKALADKTVSLNESERIKEMEEQKAIGEARKKERQARKKADEKIYEVNLGNVDKPGLTVASAKDKDDEDAASVKIEGEEEEDQTPTIDATLEEAKRILIDYILLSKKENPAVTLK